MFCVAWLRILHASCSISYVVYVVRVLLSNLTLLEHQAEAILLKERWKLIHNELLKSKMALSMLRVNSTVKLRMTANETISLLTTIVDTSKITSISQLATC